MSDEPADSWRRVPDAEETAAAIAAGWGDERWATAANFCSALEDPVANLDLLKWFTTPESHERWGDFSEESAHLLSIEDRGYGSMLNPALDANEVLYFKIIRGVTDSYQVAEEQLMIVPAVITLVFHPFENRWMIEAYGDPARPEEIPCLRGDSARWDGPQRRRFIPVPVDAWVTQHGTKRMDGSGTFNFSETPRWNRDRFIELEVSMIEGKVTVAEAVRARRGMSPVRPKDRVRYFRAQALAEAFYMPCRTPTGHNIKHVSVYGDMNAIGVWVPPGAEQLIHIPAHRRWWDRAERVSLESLAEGHEE